MQDFEGRIAVVTGGGTGMGRELVRQLAAEGCHVAMCDVAGEAMATSRETALAGAPPGTVVSTFEADVSDDDAMVAFAAHVAEAHDTDHVHLLCNNAGIGGGGSFVAGSREEWDKTFAVCWGGVYNGCRAFLAMLLAAPEGHIVNTSSVNGFWASLGPRMPHTAYSAAKFAVKGFSEALLADLAVHAPHLGVSVVMPGHIGTDIVINSGRILGRDPKELDATGLAQVRSQLADQGIDVGEVSDEDLRVGLQMQGELFRDAAPTTAAEAAAVILQGVRDRRWRILVGDDAEVLDRLVREAPEEAYDRSFRDRLKANGVFTFMP